MTTRQSTPEEIQARQAEVVAAECKGDGVHAELRFSHDWRLWQREPTYEYLSPDDDFASLRGSLVGFREVWYCTRCRKIEKREAKT